MADDKAKKVPLEVSMMKRIGELKAENARLKQQVEYWRIESDCNHGRWLRCLEDLERLRASSFVTAVPSEQYERVIKAGDDLAANVGNDERSQDVCAEAWRAAKNGGQP